jgi:hypothetical protein
MIADRIGVLAGLARELRRCRNELSRDRIVRVVDIDQGGDVRRDRNRVACRDLLQVGEIGGAREAVSDQLRRFAQRRCECLAAHGSPEGGVQTT